jgi:zinc protease
MEEDTFTDGGWAISATFAPELLDKGIAATRRELLKWWKDGVTAQELEDRKKGIVGEFQLSLASSDGVSTAILTAVQRGYDLSYLDEYPRRIQALTVEDVNRAIRKYIDPDKLVLVKAGTVR